MHKDYTLYILYIPHALETLAVILLPLSWLSFTFNHISKMLFLKGEDSIINTISVTSAAK